MFEENEYAIKTKEHFSLGTVGSNDQIMRMLGYVPEDEVSMDVEDVQL